MNPLRRTVLVTGGSRGIGRAIVRCLAAAGYEVVFTYASSEERARELVSEFEGAPAKVAAVYADLSRPAAAEELSRSLLAREVVPYGLVCNAGASYDVLSAQTDMERARKLFELNFFSALELMKAFARPMARRNAGRIVLIGSVASERGTRGNALYAATKGALQSYLRGVIEEFAKRGVTANCVRPGMIVTDMTAHYRGGNGDDAPRIPAHRFGRPEEVAQVVQFLLSEGASYINGASIDVDGGLSATLGSA